jgi:Ca-activated chloride channel family protein
MTHKISLTILVFIFSSTIAFAQSGRVKTTETPAPTPRPRLVYIPTQSKIETPKPVSTPTPTPKPKDEDEGEIIKVDSTLVPIPVSVTDQTGKAVTNLKLEDFELLIDGKAAEISELSRSETPVRLAMLFDNSSSVSQAREFELKAAIKFFKRVLRPDKDLAALYSVSEYSRLEQPLTKNVAQITAAIENFPAPQGATALLDAIVKAADYLKVSDGRRVILIVSDGEDTYSDLETTLEKVVRVVQAANCQVYVVKTTDFENFKRTGQRNGNANILKLTAERRMQELAQQTGGAVYSPIDERELDAAFAQISAELSQSYILSYYPENDAKNQNEFRTISLSVKSRPNFTLRTRKGYYVPKSRE